MWKVTIPRHAWIALCNGSRGLMPRNHGDTAHLNPRTVEEIKAKLSA